MNFNLIAMKESVDMERLTRVTLLLTKATILFLPVSLMSAYFSRFDGGEVHSDRVLGQLRNHLVLQLGCSVPFRRAEWQCADCRCPPQPVARSEEVREMAFVCKVSISHDCSEEGSSSENRVNVGF